MGLIIKKSLQRNDRCTTGDLLVGDRFYFLKDPKRIVHQVTQRQTKKLLYIQASIADRNVPEEKLIQWSEVCSFSRYTVFIRNIKDSKNDA